MMKTIFLLILSLVMTQSLWARNPLLMTREQFVHLSDQEKENVVIQTMELIVELEARYQHETASPVKSSEVKKQIQKLFTKLNSFLMSSAYAQTNISTKTWAQRGNDFVKLMETKNRCLYGGWVSTVINNVCVHPSKSPDIKVRNAYKNTASKSCEGKGVNKIACNPVIFGFSQLNKSEASSTLFCVNAGSGPAHNSALECMEKATAKKENLAFLKEKLSSSENEKITNGVHHFITQACVCTDQPKNINQKYHEYMRPHRTCYGMMNMISNTYGQCEVGKNPIFDQFETINQSLISKIVKSPKRDNETDSLYASLLKEHIPTKEYAALCGGEAPGPGPDKDDKDPVTPEGPACKTISCEKKTGEGATGFKCEVEIYTGKKDAEPVKMSIEPPTDDIPFVVKLSEADPSFKDSEASVSCAVEQGEDNTIQCTKMSLDVKDGVVTATAEYELKDTKVQEGAAPTWTPPAKTGDAKTATFDLPKDATSFKASLSLPLDGGKTLACEGEWKQPEADDKNKPTIKPKKESENPATVKVIGILTQLEKEVKKVDGYVAVWFRKGHEKLDLPKVKKEEEKKDDKTPGIKIAGDGDGAEPKKEEKAEPKKEDPKVVDGKEEIARDTLTVEAPRSPKGDYEVCVELQGKEVIDGGCVKIPKIAAPGGMPQMQGPMRRFHGTAAPLSL